MPRNLRPCLAHVLLGALLFVRGLLAAENPFVLTLQKSAQENFWILSWPAAPGSQYTLQKSGDLATWTDVTTLTAESNLLTQIDSGLTNENRTFWRVALLSDDTNALIVSSVVASYQLGAGASKAMLRVLTSGTQTVSSVIFLDNGVLLGNAAPGLGNLWTFNLVWDGVTRQTRSVLARVTTEEGTTVDSETRGFLLADPGRFVPVNPDGTLALGQFVPVDPAGNLGAFLLYPEGFAEGTTGAHIEFPAGATLTDDGRIQLTAATFHRGHNDDSPLSATSGTHTINPDAVTPGSVATAFGPARRVHGLLPRRRRCPLRSQRPRHLH